MTTLLDSWIENEASRRGITRTALLRELEETVGVSVSTWTNVANGLRLVRVDKARAIADATGVPFESLIKGGKL